MLESLAYLHHSCSYEQADPIELSPEALKTGVSVSIALLACAASSPPSTAMPPLNPGDSGPEVAYLTQRLRKANCLPPSASLDRYDKVVTAGVSSLQRQHGLLMNGVVNEQTAAAIEAGWFCQASEDSGALKRGNQGKEVEMLQAQLKNWGFPLAGQEFLQVTGVFDKATEDTLKEFEKFFGLQEDGIFDPLDSEILWTPRGEALAKRIMKLGGTYSDDSGKAFIAAGSETVPRLTPFLQSQNPLERGRAAVSLGKLGANAKSAVPDLVPLLTDDAEATATGIPVSGLVIEALAEMGPAAAEATEALEKILNTDDDGFKNDAVALTLRKVDPSLSVLLENLSSESLPARASSALALGLAEPSNQKVIDALRNTLEDGNEDSRVRKRAAISLTMLGQNLEPSNFDDEFQKAYAEFYEKWENCPYRPTEITNSSDSRTFFEPIGERCASLGEGGGPGDYIRRIFGLG